MIHPPTIRIVFSVFILSACSAADGLALEPLFPNRAATSELPRGNGLAAAFVADRGIENHAAVIFADQFESENAGGLAQRWDSPGAGGGRFLSLVDSGHPACGKKALRVEARLGENEGDGLTQWFPSDDTLFIRFYVRFDQNCDYVHHFVTLRANRGLTGRDRWSGFGGAGNRPQGDQRFSTALEPWGDWGRWTPPGRWNFYSYWHEMKPSPDGKFWGNAFRPDDQPLIPKGEWICAEFMLKHNTPGQADGEQAYWIDGELIGHWTGIPWRTSATLMANALTVEAYVTDRWTQQKVNVVDFDNVVIAKQYIGPAGGDR